MKRLFLLSLVGVVFFCGGCATVMVQTEPQSQLQPSQKVEFVSEKEKAKERFDKKVAQSFAEFRCPDKEAFEYAVLEAGFSAIFDNNESRRNWIKDIYNLTQEYSNGSVYVGEIKSQQKFGLYDENEEMYIFVFSSEERREYAFRKKTNFRKTNFLGCEETKRERFVREITGG